MSTADNHYVDGFVLPVPKARLEDYRAMAAKAAAIWLEYGALEYRECVGDDMAIEGMLGFPKIAGASDDEAVIFAWITYESKEKRNEVNAKVMADPRLMESCQPENMPFDCQRMACGGFRTLVKA